MGDNFVGWSLPALERLHMYRTLLQFRYGVHQAMLHLLGDGMALRDRQAAFYTDAELGEKPVAGPSSACVIGREDSGHV